MNPQSSFHPPTDFCSIGISRGITVTKCVAMHICTKIKSAISESIQVSSYPFTCDTRMPPSLGTGLTHPPDYTESISIPLIKQRVVPLSPSRERPVRQGSRTGDKNIKSRF
jgi:hypothetical protein